MAQNESLQNGQGILMLIWLFNPDHLRKYRTKQRESTHEDFDLKIIDCHSVIFSKVKNRDRVYQSTLRHGFLYKLRFFSYIIFR